MSKSYFALLQIFIQSLCCCATTAPSVRPPGHAEWKAILGQSQTKFGKWNFNSREGGGTFTKSFLIPRRFFPPPPLPRSGLKCVAQNLWQGQGTMNPTTIRHRCSNSNFTLRHRKALRTTFYSDCSVISREQPCFILEQGCFPQLYHIGWETAVGRSQNLAETLLPLCQLQLLTALGEKRKLIMPVSH